MTRWAVLLLPIAGLLLYDPVSFDNHAVKSSALFAIALLCIASGLLKKRLAWFGTLSLALWIFLAVRGWMLLEAPYSGRALRWWGLAFALILVHHAAGIGVSRAWLARLAPPLFGTLAALLGALAVFQFIEGAPQAHATFANRSFAGAGMAMLLPYLLAARRGWLRRAGILLFVAGLAAMRSRTGWLAASAALVLYLTWNRPRLKVALLLGIPALVIAAGIAFGDRNTVKVRLVWYRAALKMGLQHPLTGLGADGFKREYPPVRDLEEHAISGGSIVHAVHDDYLESFAEGGLAGLLAHLFVLLTAAFALRRRRWAAASLLAFAVGSLVDLPLRDPSLLALGFFPLAMARRKTVAFPGLAPPLALAGLLATGWFFMVQLDNWRADRLFGAYLATRKRFLLDRALDLDPHHPGALLERCRKADLDRLLQSEPHNANARYDEVAFLPQEQRIPALRRILLHDDPHHVRTRVLLARLVMDVDPVQAASLLEGAISADPRPAAPYLLLARLHRKGGRLQVAAKYLRQAERRKRTRAGALERLALETARLREGRCDERALRNAVLRLPSQPTRKAIEKALAEGAAIEKGARPAPLVPRPEESALDFAKRIDAAKRAAREKSASRALPAFRTALVLARALVTAHPGAGAFKLLGEAAKKLGDIDQGTKMEAVALFLKALQAVTKDDLLAARRDFRRARRAYPELAKEPAVTRALKTFAKNHPKAEPRLRKLLGADPAWAAALGRAPGR